MNPSLDSHATSSSTTCTLPSLPPDRPLNDFGAQSEFKSACIPSGGSVLASVKRGVSDKKRACPERRTGHRFGSGVRPDLRWTRSLPAAPRDPTSGSIRAGIGRLCASRGLCRFAAAKLALDLDGRRLLEARREFAEFGEEAAVPLGPRSHSPSPFFHERFVATDTTVKADPLLPDFISASPPVNPMRVTLLRYMMFFSPVLPVCPGHWRLRGHRRSQGQRRFSGGTRMGQPEPERRRKAKQRLRRPQGAGTGGQFRGTTGSTTN